MARRAHYTVTVSIDDRWPICPDNGPVLKGTVNQYTIFGWYTEAEFQTWLKKRNGSIVRAENETRVVVAELTAKEARQAR
ncbi:MAG: hypothetical protein ACYSUV_18735 [Planctomycetota bacterium]|jgi:hypothetical protein